MAEMAKIGNNGSARPTQESSISLLERIGIQKCLVRERRTSQEGMAADRLADDPAWRMPVLGLCILVCRAGSPL